MRIYFLEDLTAAKALAKAFGCELNTYRKNTAKITANGEPAVVFWYERMRLLGSERRPQLSEKADRILDSLAEDGGSEFVIALFPTRTTVLFTEAVRRKFQSRGINVYTALFTTLRKRDILHGLDNAKTAREDSTDVIQATSERLNAYSVTNAIWKLIPPDDFDMRLDLNLLTALCLINKRSALEHQPRFRIKTSIEAGGRSILLTSEEGFTEESARLMIGELGRTLQTGPVRIMALPTAVSLYRVYDKYEQRELNIRDTAVSLYKKRYISNPFTLSGALPDNVTENLKSEVISACRAQSPNEAALDIDALNSFDILSEVAPSAILPLKNSTVSLSDSEAALYKEIVSAASEVICTDVKDTLVLTDKKTETVFTAPCPQDFLSRKKSFTPGPLSYELDGIFSAYSIRELMDTLVGYGLESSDVIMSLIDRLVKTGAAYTDNFGVHMTKKGEDAIRTLPFDPEDVISLFRTVNSPSDEEADINAHLVRISNDVSRTLAGWLSAKGNGKKETPAPAAQKPELVAVPENTKEESEKTSPPIQERPAPVPPSKEEKRDTVPVSAGAALACPFCGENNMKEEKERFTCNSCGSILEKKLPVEGAFFTITEKDVRNLSSTGRTKLKRGKDADGRFISGGYIILTGRGFELSHRSNNLCPYCGNPLEGYLWGFKCSSCSFGVPFEAYHMQLKNSDVLKLLAGEKTEPVYNLLSPTGERFDARLLALPSGKIRPYMIKKD